MSKIQDAGARYTAYVRTQWLKSSEYGKLRRLENRYLFECINKCQVEDVPNIALSTILAGFISKCMDFSTFCRLEQSGELETPSLKVVPDSIGVTDVQ